MLTRREYSSTAPQASPITVDTTLNGTVISKGNPKRLSVTLQNTGLEPCIIRLGGNPSASAYNFVLAADGAALQGNGGSVTIEDFTGDIKGITQANSTTIAVTEVGV